MKVVLKKTYESLGTVGDTLEVKAGFARNFLFPRSLAVLSNDPQAKKLRAGRSKTLAAIAVQQKLVSELAKNWEGQTYRLTARASTEGTLYASLGHKEISKLLGRDDLEFEVEPIKSVGTHVLNLKFSTGLNVSITLIVEPEAKAKSKKEEI